ncbi:MAG TPA: transaldolase [Desulfobacteraceae bacterium]|jgi:transaldolase|nr:transaldolase [Desulfobacteraceae bacterium]
MNEKHILERLVDVSPGMEIWWDSSPLILSAWCQQMLEKAAPGDRDVLQRQLSRMYRSGAPGEWLFRGVTTNPRLSLQAIDADRETWAGIVDGLIEKNQGVDKEGLFWLMYKEVIKRGSDMFLPLFEASGYKQGFLSGQVDPRDVFDSDAMMRQAEELAALNPNVMIKIPGSKEGYSVIEALTARGISTNNTLTFVLPQLMDCANSVKRGLETARKNGVDLSRWRSVITHMESRYGDLGGLRNFAAEKGIELTDGEVRLAELAIFKKAYRLLNEGGYNSKMLSCSLRVGPTVDGKLKLWHLEEKAGADIVVTCPPPFIDELSTFPGDDDLVFEKDRIWKEIPGEVMDKLMRIPYFERAYEEDGYTRDEYNTHPALIKTADQFSAATVEMVEFAGSCIEKAQR